MEFAKLAAVFETLESTTKRLEITGHLSQMLKECAPSELKKVVYLCQGRLVPEHEGTELGIGDKLAEQAISTASGKTVAEIERCYRKTGDLGETAAQLLEAKQQTTLSSQQNLSVQRVYDNLYKIATASGTGSQEMKVKLLAELLSHSSASEGKVIVRFATGSLRLGVAEATIIDALSFSSVGDKSLRVDLERAFNLRNDLGLVAEVFARDGIGEIRKICPKPFSPIRPALAERLESPAAIIEKLGECGADAKIDGFRVQVHKDGERVELFSRKLEPTTHMFPDLVEAVRKQIHCKQAILEGEAIAFNDSTGEFLPFQATMQRKRKHGVEAKSRELPLKLFVFELLFADGVDLTGKPFSERRALLEKIVGKGDTISPSQFVLVKTGDELEKFFDECVSAGLEGVIAKDLAAPYTAGARKFSWIKFKKSYASKLADTVDAVIVGYYLGKGKRTEFGFGGFLAAVLGEDNRFKTICKVGTGFTEKEMSSFKKTLDEIKLKEKHFLVDSLIGADVWVKPQIVVTLTADELTVSPMHSCGIGKIRGKEKEGLALRFPRLTQLRDDKAPKDATTEKEILEMFELQGKSG